MDGIRFGGFCPLFIDLKSISNLTPYNRGALKYSVCLRNQTLEVLLTNDAFCMLLVTVPLKIVDSTSVS